jgi:hypothetical protein
VIDTKHPGPTGTCERRRYLRRVEQGVCAFLSRTYVIAIATRPLKEAAGFEVLGAFREAPVRVRMRIPRRRKNGCGRVLFGLAGPVHQRVPSAVCGQVVEGAGEVAGAGDVTELTTTLDRNRSPPLLPRQERLYRSLSWATCSTKVRLGHRPRSPKNRRTRIRTARIRTFSGSPASPRSYDERTLAACESHPGQRGGGPRATTSTIRPSATWVTCANRTSKPENGTSASDSTPCAGVPQRNVPACRLGPGHSRNCGQNRLHPTPSAPGRDGVLDGRSTASDAEPAQPNPSDPGRCARRTRRV